MLLYHFLFAALLGLINGDLVCPLSRRDLKQAIARSAEDKAHCPDYCADTDYNATLKDVYVCGDYRLGPVRLPKNLPLDDLVDDYHRFGHLCPGKFLQTWFNESTNSFNYPPKNGFQLDTSGNPIMGTFDLPVGLLVDRFGSEYGNFVSPKAAPYTQRALPPLNLDTPQASPQYPYNYHVYRVTKSFTAQSGPIAGWFGQPGQGVQYQLSQRIIDLLGSNNLARVTLS